MHRPTEEISRCCEINIHWKTDHWLDIRMRDSVEFVVVQFEVRADVDVCSLIFGRVAIFWCREDCLVVSKVV